MLRSGNDGEPLPDGTLIFRIGKDIHLNSVAKEQRKALPGMFELSGKDKASPGHRLSVWIEELTVADQGWAFMGSRPVNTVVACLNVDDIRAMPRQQPFDALDVQVGAVGFRRRHGEPSAGGRRACGHRRSESGRQREKGRQPPQSAAVNASRAMLPDLLLSLSEESQNRHVLPAL